MIVCVTCGRRMRPKKIGVPVVQLAGEDPYELWMTDLLQCVSCGVEVFYTSPQQQPIARQHEPDFTAKLASYKPQYQVRER